MGGWGFGGSGRGEACRHVRVAGLRANGRSRSTCKLRLVALGAHEDILRLNVAVRHAVQMQMLEPKHESSHPVSELGLRDDAFLLDGLGERAPVHKLHDQVHVRHRRVIHNLIEVDHVRMVQTLHTLNLELEIVGGCQLRRTRIGVGACASLDHFRPLDHLDRHHTLLTPRCNALRFVDFAVRALPEPVGEFVPVELRRLRGVLVHFEGGSAARVHHAAGGEGDLVKFDHNQLTDRLHVDGSAPLGRRPPPEALDENCCVGCG